MHFGIPASSTTHTSPLRQSTSSHGLAVTGGVGRHDARVTVVVPVRRSTVGRGLVRTSLTTPVGSAVTVAVETAPQPPQSTPVRDVLVAAKTIVVGPGGWTVMVVYVVQGFLVVAAEAAVAAVTMRRHESCMFDFLW